MIEILLKYIVHHVLEICWGFGETEWHHLVLEMPITCLEGRFPLVSMLDAHQIVEAWFGVNRGALELRARDNNYAP